MVLTHPHFCIYLMLTLKNRALSRFVALMFYCSFSAKPSEEGIAQVGLQRYVLSVSAVAEPLQLYTTVVSRFSVFDSTT